MQLLCIQSARPWKYINHSQTTFYIHESICVVCARGKWYTRHNDADQTKNEHDSFLTYIYS